ncbi:MAG TPA: 50S ribosomal protein L4 [Nitrospinota bacterium]|nr:50S ribosomal protein L4 [Nitrospinota bacterium]
MELAIVDTKNKKVGSLEVSEDVFGADINEHILHEVVVMQLANKRRGTASTKIRDEVRGGGKKPWKQKGTGRARAGSSRSPIWRGGGVSFGPKPRDYSYKVPKKVRKIALKSALSYKVKNNDIVVLDKFESQFSKTKEVALLLKDLKILNKALFLIEQENKNLQLAARNLPNARVLNLAGLNVYDLLYSSKLILTQSTISKIEERLQ